jgi:hypothetical protein
MALDHSTELRAFGANFRLRNFARQRNKETWLLLKRASMRPLTGSIWKWELGRNAGEGVAGLSIMKDEVESERAELLFSRGG